MKNLKQSHKYYIQILTPLLTLLLFLILFTVLEHNNDTYADWVNDSPIIRLIVSSIVTILFLSFVQYLFSEIFGEGRLNRVLSKYQRKSIRECESGETVILTGNANIAEKTVITPFTNKECIGFKITSQHKVDVTTDANRPTLIWEDFNVDSNYPNFLVVDGDGEYAYVLTDNAEFVREEEIVFSKCEKEMFTKESEKKARAVLKQMGILLRSNYIAHDKAIRFIEARFDFDEKILVCGTGNWQSVNIYPELEVLKELGVNQIYVVNKFENQPLIISDSVEHMVAAIE